MKTYMMNFKAYIQRKMFVLILFQNKTKYVGGLYTTLEGARDAQRNALGEMTPYCNGCQVGERGLISWIREVPENTPMRWSLGLNVHQ